MHSLTNDGMIVYVANLKDLTRKLKELFSDYSKFAEYKVNVQNSSVFLQTNNEQVEFKIKNSIPFTLLPRE